MFLFKIIAACYLNLSTSCGSMSGNKLTLFIYLQQSRFVYLFTAGQIFYLFTAKQIVLQQSRFFDIYTYININYGLVIILRADFLIYF